MSKSILVLLLVASILIVRHVFELKPYFKAKHKTKPIDVEDCFFSKIEKCSNTGKIHRIRCIHPLSAVVTHFDPDCPKCCKNGVLRIAGLNYREHLQISLGMGFVIRRLIDAVILAAGIALSITQQIFGGTE